MIASKAKKDDLKLAKKGPPTVTPAKPNVLGFDETTTTDSVAYKNSTESDHEEYTAMAGKKDSASKHMFDFLEDSDDDDEVAELSPIKSDPFAWKPEGKEHIETTSNVAVNIEETVLHGIISKKLETVMLI